MKPNETALPRRTDTSDMHRDLPDRKQTLRCGWRALYIYIYKIIEWVGMDRVDGLVPTPYIRK